jgi:hypothetical protein
MPYLIITDIRKGHFDSEFELITAVLSAEDHDPRLLSLIKKSCSRLLAFEGANCSESSVGWYMLNRAVNLSER